MPYEQNAKTSKFEELRLADFEHIFLAMISTTLFQFQIEWLLQNLPNAVKSFRLIHQFFARIFSLSYSLQESTVVLYQAHISMFFGAFR